MIHKLHANQLDSVLQLWLTTNQESHDFIDPMYWQQQLPHVKSMMQQAEIFVYEQDHELYGFVGLFDTDIAGIFVDSARQNRGIGTALLNFLKEHHRKLTLAVYEKNQRAVAFYQAHDFEIVTRATDEATGEIEYHMAWIKKRA